MEEESMSEGKSRLCGVQVGRRDRIGDEKAGWRLEEREKRLGNEKAGWDIREQIGGREG